MKLLPRFPKPSSEFRPWLVAAIWVYFTVLFGWFGAYLLTGDRLAYVALLNTLAVYLFLPLPLVLAAAPWLRRKEVWVGGLSGLLAFGWLWGALFLPDPGGYPSSSPTLKVMTYNVLGNHTRTDAILNAIQAAGADLVFIQELNPQLAVALQSELKDAYPFQLLDPMPGVTGMGTISRYPLHPHPLQLPLNWVGEPQEMTLSWEGSEITLINFHMFPSGLSYPWAVEAVYRAREAQARALAAYVAKANGPVLAAGDANVTDLSDAYQLFTADLQDAWRAAGWGLGHTFPGSDIPGSARPRIAGWPVPRWLARIDFILFSSHWQAVHSEMAPIDEVSDHRGVLADLILAR